MSRFMEPSMLSTSRFGGTLTHALQRLRRPESLSGEHNGSSDVDNECYLDGSEGISVAEGAWRLDLLSKRRHIPAAPPTISHLGSR